MTSQSGRCILIAEDEGLVALELEQLLHDLGYETLGPVSRLVDLVAELERPAFDGALLDVNLRGELVFDVLPRFKQLGIPFIITSGYDAVTLFPPEFRTVPRIVKPVDEAALRRECVRLFGKG